MSLSRVFLQRGLSIKSHLNLFSLSSCIWHGQWTETFGICAVYFVAKLMSPVKEADLKINFQTYGGRELHTLSEHTHTTTQHKQGEFCSGIPVWRGATVDDLIVVGMNGLPKTEKSICAKKLFQSARRPLGWEPGGRTRSECLWWISCHCQPDSRWAAAPPDPHLLAAVFKQWGTITGRGSGRAGRSHLSASFPPPRRWCLSELKASVFTASTLGVLFSFFIFLTVMWHQSGAKSSQNLPQYNLCTVERGQRRTMSMKRATQLDLIHHANLR